MFKNERTYYILLSALVFVYVLVQLLQPKPLDWTESFSSEDKIPYGGYLLHELLPKAFPEEALFVNSAPLFEYADTANAQKNWIFINTSFGLDKWEAKRLLSQVEKGTHVFIAARNFQQAFQDTLKISTAMNNPLLHGGSILDDDTVFVNFSNPALKTEQGFAYRRSTTETYFSGIDSTLQTRRLGINNEGKPNFLSVRFGEGYLYLHSNPTLFTNYFVRDKKGADYALKALSYLPNRETIWDEYYKSARAGSGSAVRYIVSEKYLSRAWFLSLIGVILFMIFRAKRKQRIIPIIQPPTNSSIDFAKTIGNLYLEKGSHKLIADKKISFFFDYIRTNLNLDTADINAETKQDISQRSGIDRTEIDGLFQLINTVSGKEEITKKQLSLLTERIDEFYNQSQR